MELLHSIALRALDGINPQTLAILQAWDSSLDLSNRYVTSVDACDDFRCSQIDIFLAWVCQVVVHSELPQVFPQPFQDFVFISKSLAFFTFDGSRAPSMSSYLTSEPVQVTATVVSQPSLLSYSSSLHMKQWLSPSGGQTVYFLSSPIAFIVLQSSCRSLH